MARFRIDRVSFQENPDNFRADFVASGLADAMIVIGTTSNRAAWDYFAQAQASGLDFVCWGSPGSPFHWMRSENDIGGQLAAERSEEHTSELQSLMRISYAVFCLKKKNKT